MTDLNDIQRPYFVPKLEVPSSGVDFLGLRQVNLNMMAHCIPGINNVTWHVRPFSLISWIYWEFRNLCEQQGKAEVASDEMQAFQEKIETLFTWGAMLDERSPSVPGKGSVIPSNKAGVALSFAAWKRSARNTGLMAAVQYGPASKNIAGLGFIEPVRANLFKVTPEGAKIAEAFDKAIRAKALHQVKLVDRLGTMTADQSLAEALWKAWNVYEVSAVERRAFRDVFYSSKYVGDYSHDLGRRSSTLELVREILRVSKTSLGIEDIRKAMVHLKLPSGESINVQDNLRLARLRWSLLQVRQLQRLAFEALMSWVEGMIHLNAGGTDAQDMVRQGIDSINANETGILKNRPLSHVYQTLTSKAGAFEKYLSKGATDDEVSIFASMDRIAASLKSRENILEESLYGLSLVAVITSLAEETGELSDEVSAGGEARISLKEWEACVKGIMEMPLHDALAFIVETHILSQHFSTALSRYDGRGQRLRFTIEEEGLTALVRDLWQPILSRDRLAVALSLMADCDLLMRDGDMYSIN